MRVEGLSIFILKPLSWRLTSAIFLLLQPVLESFQILAASEKDQIYLGSRITLINATTTNLLYDIFGGKEETLNWLI